MPFGTMVRVAVDSLLCHKLRSFLAMLGIIIGVAAMIAMIALVRGAEQEVLAQIRSLGVDVVMLRPGLFGASGVITGAQRNLTPADADAVAAEVPRVAGVAPVVKGTVQVKYFGRNSRSLLVGSSPDYFTVRGFDFGRGRAFAPGETRVAVLGPTPAEALFGAADPVGETVKINGLSFRVTGVLRSKGDQGWMNLDDQVVVPGDVAMRQILGIDHLHEVHILAAPGADVRSVSADVASIMRRRHRIREGEPDDFYVRTIVQAREMAERISGTFRSLLGAVTGLSLVIGGIGIMNIMIVSVRERIREIGVRKAIGARDRDILRQFLVEALIMSLLGGFLGVCLGIAAARLIPRLTEFSTTVEPWSILLALTSAAGVGIFFGYYPARNAARMDPIEALHDD